mgnify:CR=1 FL=1
MYRAPEMLDTWSNYPVDMAADIWACGCILFVLCFHHHPFEDSAKLAILNGNFKIPPHDGHLKNSSSASSNVTLVQSSFPQ